jgi:hypothetical protein
VTNTNELDVVEQLGETALLLPALSIVDSPPRNGSCAELSVEAEARACAIGERRFRKGEVVTLDADAGAVRELPVVVEHPIDALTVEGLRPHLA